VLYQQIEKDALFGQLLDSDFGDGNTSTLQSPSHTYNSATNFVAQLTVTGINGQTSAMVRTITVTNAPAPVPTLFIEPQALSAPVQSKTAQIAPATPPGLVLKWQNASAHYDIESSSDLNSGRWQVVPQSPVLSNGWNQITLPTTNSSQFFRLRQR